MVNLSLTFCFCPISNIQELLEKGFSLVQLRASAPQGEKPQNEEGLELFPWFERSLPHLLQCAGLHNYASNLKKIWIISLITIDEWEVNCSWELMVNLFQFSLKKFISIWLSNQFQREICQCHDEFGCWQVSIYSYNKSYEIINLTVMASNILSLISWRHCFLISF